MFKTFLLGSCLAAAAVALPAQSFDKPVRIKGGETFAGHKLNNADRLYPSPGMFDVDGDGLIDMVIGDLRGSLTWVKRTKDGWGEEKQLNDVDGKPLKFHNW
jgi:hypothetical protein